MIGNRVLQGYQGEARGRGESDDVGYANLCHLYP